MTEASNYLSLEKKLYDSVGIIVKLKKKLKLEREVNKELANRNENLRKNNLLLVNRQKDASSVIVSISDHLATLKLECDRSSTPLYPHDGIDDLAKALDKLSTLMEIPLKSSHLSTQRVNKKARRQSVFVQLPHHSGTSLTRKSCDVSASST